MAFLFVTSYAAMVAAGLAVEFLFSSLGLVPADRVAIVAEPQVTLNYTSVLDVLAFALAAVLVARAFRTGVGPMIAVMDVLPESLAHEGHR